VKALASGVLRIGVEDGVGVKGAVINRKMRNILRRMLLCDKRNRHRLVRRLNKG
jgi:hypothetical protein